MDISKIKKALKNFELKKIDNNTYTIDFTAEFMNQKPLEVYVVNKLDKWYFSDEKQTLKYMNDLYELNSKDVKSCIQNVVKLYGFSISAGCLLAEIDNENKVNQKLINFYMCVAQLANMYVFFDQP